MNCLQCNAPLEDQARFCRNCNNPVAIGSSPMLSADDSPTIPAPMNMPMPQPQYAPQAQWQAPLILPASPQRNAAPAAQPVSPQSQYAPQEQWMPQAQPMPPQIGSMQSAGTLQGKAAPRRKRKWPLRLLMTLVVLIVLLTGGWFLAGRPILHSVAQNQFDQLLGSQINTIPSLPSAITSLQVTENELNNLITLNHAPSDPVQNAVAHVAPAVIASDGSYTGGVELDFQLFGFGCSIKGVPVASNGEIVMTHVQVSGVLSLVMSSDEMTTLLNGHLHDAIAHLHRQVTSITLKNQEVDIQLG